MKKLNLIWMIIFMIGIVNAANYWVTDPSTCPATDATNFPGQDCSPNNICGDSSGIAQCYDTSTIVAPAGNLTSNTNWDSSTNGGYVLNCFATADASDPKCDNSGNFWCDRNETCYSTQKRNTVCVGTDAGGDFGGPAICTTCRTNFLDCNADGGVCEIQVGASCGFSTGTYAGCNGTAGNCTSSLNLDCNNDDGDNDVTTCNGGSDGCEITIGGACTVGSLSGTYSGVCSGSSGTCVVDKSPFVTGNYTQYQTNSTEGGFLWGKDFGTSAPLINFTGGNNDTFIVSNDGNVTTSGWFSGLYDWTVSFLSDYIFGSFNGNTLEIDINETKLNDTFVNVAGDTMTGKLDIIADLNVSNSGTGAARFFMENTEGNGELRYDNGNFGLTGGSLGVGTNSPGSVLEVVGASYLNGLLELGSHGSEGGEIRIHNNTGTVVFFIDEVGNRLRLRHNDYPDLLTLNGDNGYVGVGTVPSYELHVKSSSSASDYLSADASSGSARAFIRETGSNEVFLALDDSSGNEDVRIYSIDDSYIVNDIRLGGNGAANNDLSVTADADIGGSLAIGTTSPSYNLHVDSGTTDITSFFKSSDANADILLQDNGQYTRIRSTDGEFRIYTNSDTEANVISTENGNVGFGLSNPSYELHTQGSESVENYIETTGASTSYAGVRVGSPVGDWGLYTGETSNPFIPGDFGIYDWDATRYRLVIKDDGDVGINTANPNANLHINESTGSADIRLDTAGTYPGGGIYFDKQGSNEASFVYANNPGISSMFLQTGDTSEEIEIRPNTVEVATFDDTLVSINIGGHSTVDFNVEGDTEANLLYADASADYIGIGTNSPSNILDVVGDLEVSEDLLVGGTTGIIDGSTQIEAYSATGNAGITIHNDDGGDETKVRFRRGTADWEIGQQAASTDFSWQYEDNEFIRINTAGRMGVGTTSIDEELQVEGNDDIYVKIEATGSNSDSGLLMRNDVQQWQLFVWGGGGSNDYFAIRDGTAGTYAMKIEKQVDDNLLYLDNDGTGEIGISTTAPVEKFHIAEANAEPEMVLERTDTSVTTNEDIGEIDFYGGEDGTEAAVASIRAEATASWTTTSSPTRLSFGTTSSGSTTFTDRMKLSEDGWLTGQSCVVAKEIMIFAEESSALSSTGEYWSFGNGATTHHGLTMPCAGTVTSLTLNCATSTATTGKVQIGENGVAQGTGCQVSTPGVADGSSIDTSCDIAFATGAEINFMTTTAHSGSSDCRVTATIQFT